MDELSLNSSFLYETKEQLSKSDYHDVSEAVEWLLTDNDLDVNRESESFKRLCREMLKVEVKILDIAKHRDLGDYEYEEIVFPQAPVFSPELDNRPTESISEVIKHYVSESEANWTPKTKAEIVNDTGGNRPEDTIDQPFTFLCHFLKAPAPQENLRYPFNTEVSRGDGRGEHGC